MRRLAALVLAIPFCALPQQAPDTDSPLIRVTVNLVQVDATVTDRTGRVITDLRPEEFEIYQDGKPRPLTRFAFLPTNGGGTAVKAAPGDVPAPPSGSRPEQVRRTMVLVVDDLALSFESMANVRESIKKFTAMLQPGDLVALMRTASGTGTFQSFTTDHRQISQLADTLRWNYRSRTGVNSSRPVGTQGTAQQTLSRTPARDSDAAEEMILNRTAGLGTTGALQWIINGLGPVQGRKSIVLISEGFKMQTGNGDSDSVNAALSDPIRRVAAQATRAGVVIYTIDPNGGTPIQMTAADDVKNGVDPLRVLDRRAREQVQTQIPLRTLANDTGGRAFVYGTSVEDGLRRMLDDQSGFYLLGYDPASETFDRKYHKIVIKVKRKGAEVRTRNGFVGIADGAPKTLNGKPLLQALHTPFQASAIPVKLTGIYGLDEKQKPNLHCLLHIGLQGVRLETRADGKLHAQLEILVAGFDDTGEIPHNTLQTVDFAVDPAKQAETLARGMSVAVAYPLRKAGAYQLRAAVRDVATGAVGSASQFVLAPEIGKGNPTLSGLVVGPLRDSGDRIQVATRQFAPGEEVAYSVQVLNVKPSAKLRMQVRLYADGAELFASPEKELSKPEAAQGVIRLAKSISPGEYALQVVVTDAGGAQPRRYTQWTDLHVVPTREP